MAELLDPTSSDARIITGLPAIATNGGLAIGNVSGDYVDLPVGVDTQVLTLVAGQPAWQNSGGGGSAHIIKDEGVGLPARSGLNFVGAIVTATDDAGGDETDVTLAIPSLHVTNSMLAGAIDNTKLATDPLARANHTGTQLAATISDFDTQVRTSRLDQMAIPTATVDFNNVTLSNIGTATITALTEKVAPIAGDFLLGFDGVGLNMKKFDVGNLPTGGGGEANTISSQGGGTFAVTATVPKIGTDLRVISISNGAGINAALLTDVLTLAIDSTVATLTGAQTLTNKIIDSSLNTITNITNADILAAAAISHSKLQALGNGGIIVGSAGGVPTAQFVGGDATMNNAGILTVSNGTITIPKLANGTAGELITWSAGSVATTVPVGTIGQVLTSNGAGATPTFQAAGAAGEVNLAANVGVGTGLFRDKTSVTLNFKSIIAGTALSITNNVDDITLGVTAASITNTEVSASAGIAFSKLETIGVAEIIVGNGSGVPTAVAVSGDVLLGLTGITSIATGVIIDADISASAGISITKLANATAFQRIRTNAGATANEFFTETAAISFVLDGGGVAITTGIKGHIEVPFDCEIVAARLFADQTGSIVVDINADTFVNYPPTAGDTITSVTPPTISAADKSEDVTLTGWTTVLTQGDILQFEVDSAATITFATLVLTVNKRG